MRLWHEWRDIKKVNDFFKQETNIYSKHNKEYLNKYIQNLRDEGVEIGL